MYFDMTRHKVYGASIKNYLLEKSRVVIVEPGERGYHFFYWLLGASSNERLAQLKLVKEDGSPMTWQDCNYLKPSGIREENAQKEFQEVNDTFRTLNFTPEEVDFVERVCASILLMGQLNYDKKTFSDESKQGEITNVNVVKDIAYLLGISDDNFNRWHTILLNQINIIAKQELVKPLKHAEAESNRNSLAKKLFDQLFNWLVKKMNRNIMPPELLTSPDAFGQKAKTIGLLDIFGFENFAKNQFEQFCINYVNEKLHKLYIAAIFEAEKQELTEEGLADVAENIEYPETQVLEILRLMDFS